MPPDLPNETPAQLALNARISNRLQKLARMIEKELAKAGTNKDETQFSLLIWGPGGRMQYVSNAERETVRLALIELADKWTEEQDLGPVKLPLGGLH